MTIAFIIVETDLGQRDHAWPRVFYSREAAEKCREELTKDSGSYRVLGLADPDATISGGRP